MHNDVVEKVVLVVVLAAVVAFQTVMTTGVVQSNADVIPEVVEHGWNMQKPVSVSWEPPPQSMVPFGRPIYPSQGHWLPQYRQVIR